MATEGLRKPEKALTVQLVKTTREPGKYFDGHCLFLHVQPNGARQSYRRATALTVAPSTNVSATIRAFSASGQCRFSLGPNDQINPTENLH